MSKPYDGKIPFDREGNLCTYGRIGYQDCATWRDNTPFTATLKIIGFSRGRSAAYIDVVNMESGATYTMFLVDFLEALQSHISAFGEIEGQWVFCKRGTNYGVKEYVDA